MPAKFNTICVEHILATCVDLIAFVKTCLPLPAGQKLENNRFSFPPWLILNSGITVRLPHLAKRNATTSSGQKGTAVCMYLNAPNTRFFLEQGVWGKVKVNRQKTDKLKGQGAHVFPPCTDK